MKKTLYLVTILLFASTFTFYMTKWCYGKNISDESAKIIVIYVGIKGEPITIEK
ncbi:hypothetical protein [Sulfurimonas sp.]|uniref:hypothetical protein n=1 Tax=Sulfurimonas sp. TaxID=2022749 RepID=UPI0025F640F0|nr:hypothetical protein [Sulfurimonas sp.]